MTLSTYKDSQLVEDCKKGDPKAQRYLFEKYQRRMYAVCSRYISDNFEAEDITLQGFVKIFQNIGQFSGEGSFEGWMRRIMTNEALMCLRQKRMLFVEVNESHSSAYADAPEALGFNMGEADLLKLIQSLPEGYRAVFNLYAIEGYSHKEIAEMLDISEGTSKSQLSRARVILQNKLLQTDLNASKGL